MNIKKYKDEAEELEAVKQDGWTIQYIQNPSEKVQLKAVKQDGLVIHYIKNPSEKVQLTAVRQNGYAIKYICQSIRDEYNDIVVEAIKSTPYAIEHLTEDEILNLFENYVSDI